MSDVVKEVEEFLVKFEKMLLNKGTYIVPLMFYSRTGSSYTCNPPIDTTDYDWIVHVSPNERDSFFQYLEENGYCMSDSQEDYTECLSFRKDNINIIVIENIEYYSSWVAATKICKNLNLLNKDDRKMVHRIVCGEE